MKSIWCAIWILGALLVIGTLDALPDPPAENPSTALCKVPRLHDYSCYAEPRQYESFSTSYPFPASLIAANAREPYRPTDRIVLAGQAGDPSPPVHHARRKPISQS